MGEITQNIEEVKEIIDDDSAAAVKEDLDNLEQTVVEKESEYLGKINELEKRVEKMELDIQNEGLHDDALENKVEKMQSQVNQLEGLRNLEDRIEELEQNLKDTVSSRDEHIREVVEDEVKDVRKEVQTLQQQVKTAETSFEELTETVLQLSELMKKGLKSQQNVNNF